MRHGSLHSTPMRPLTALTTLAPVLAACAEAPAPQAREGPAWHEAVEVAAGRAHQGAWRMNRSDFRYVDDPTVALGPDGDMGVAWVSQAEQNVYFQRYGRDGSPRFEAPRNVSRSPTIFSWLPRLVIDEAQVYVLWQEIVFSGGNHGGEAFFARSTDGGETFEAPANLSRTTNGAGKGRLTGGYWHNGSLDLAAGPAGELYATWTEYQGPLRVRRSSDGGRTWSEPVLVAGGEGERPARGPSIAVGPAGRAHLAWTVGEDPRADIHYATSSDGGESFTAPRAVAPADAHADAPKLAVHEDGRVLLTWMESPEGPFRRYRIRFTRQRATTGGFAAPRTISNPLPPGFDSAGFPHLALDAAGNPYVLFDLFAGGSSRGTGLALTRSGDGGETFAAPSAIPRGGVEAAGVNGGLQGLLMDKLAVTPEGGVVVVNSTFLEGERSRVWLLRAR